MSNREPFQTPTHADDSAGKSLEWSAVQNNDEHTALSASANLSPLVVSHSSLAFADTSPGRPSFLILTLSQQYAQSPVTITTDAPNYFQFASDSRPTFAPELTLTPSPAGTYVHVRYAADRTGRHRGNLFIQGPHESRTIALSGRSRGLLPAGQQTRLPSRPAGSAFTNRVWAGSWWAGLLAVAVASGLALAGYNYRCQLFPGLCSNGAANQTLTTDSPVSPRQLPVDKTAEIGEQTVSLRATEKPLAASPGRNVTGTKQSDSRSPSGNQRSPASPVGLVGDAVDRKVSPKRGKQKQADVRLRRPSPVDHATEESDLERELNRNF